MVKEPYYFHVRITTPWANESRVVDFLTHSKQNLHYCYGLEVGKKTQKPHFHITLKTTRHQDTIRKDVKLYFPKLNPSDYSVSIVRELINSLAYTIKEGEYTIHWDNNEEIDDALKRVGLIQTELNFKTLKEKALNHIKTRSKDSHFIASNTECMRVLLLWFKDKGLVYPSKAWMNQTLVTYWLDIHDEEVYDNQIFSNLEMLYNIRDPYLTNNDHGPLYQKVKRLTKAHINTLESANYLSKINNEVCV